MGRNNKRGGSKYDGKVRKDKRRRTDHKGWQDVKKENAKMMKFYVAQKFFATEEEYKEFEASMRTSLASTFRITGTRESAQEFLKMIESRFFDEMQNCVVDGAPLAPPRPLAFYPDRLAWHMDVHRTMLRKEPRFQRFHQFLVAMNEKGFVSRQEAVSMIPPLLLDVEPHHKVLDMCAAPGSKTAQIIEMLHKENVGIGSSTGLVIANDSDFKRCYTLTHQAKRLNSPNFMVVNHDAGRFPSYKHADGTALAYDRVLCDVPCSGDGTIRKNEQVWQKWSPMNGTGLHPLQVRIAFRGAQLLAVGGRLVYSTCSFNPIENEAVVAELLRMAGGALKLVDVSASLPDLKRAPGLKTWKVMQKNGEFLDKFEDVPAEFGGYKRSMWPPTDEENATLNLERCVRVYPQLQDTGGFFITVFEKVAEIKGAANGKDAKKAAAAAGAATKSAPAAPPTASAPRDYSATRTVYGPTAIQASKKAAAKPPPGPDVNYKAVQKLNKGANGFKEDPYYFRDDIEDDFWTEVQAFYGFDETFNPDLLFARSPIKKRHIYYASELIRELIKSNDVETLRIINCGVKVLTLSDAKEKPTDYRLCSEGIKVVYPVLKKRVVFMALEDIVAMMEGEGLRISRLTQGSQDNIMKISKGCTVLSYEPGSEHDVGDKKGQLACPLRILAWRSDSFIKPLVNKDERHMINHLLGLEVKPKADPRARKAKDAVAPAAEASAAKPEVAEPKPSAPAPEPKAETGMDTEAEAGCAE